MLRYFLRYVSLWRTLRANFRLLPLKQALRLPIFVGRRTELAGLRKGIVRLE